MMQTDRDVFRGANCKRSSLDERQRDGRGSPPQHRNPVRLLASVAVTCALALSITACGGGTKPEIKPTPSQQSTTTEPDPEAWRADYSPKQLKAYDAALQRWESYGARSEAIWAKGKTTPAAKSLFKEFFPHPIWISEWEKLKGYERGKVKISRTPNVYWSKARSISANGKYVVINQCLDFTPVVTTQHGAIVERPTPKPQLRTVTLQKPEGYSWLIYKTVDLKGKKARPCTP